MFASLIPMGAFIIIGLSIIIVNGIEADHARHKTDRRAREVEAHNKNKAYEKMLQERNPQKIDNVDHTKLWMGD